MRFILATIIVLVLCVSSYAGCGCANGQCNSGEPVRNTVKAAAKVVAPVVRFIKNHHGQKLLPRNRGC
jgi:hypothetical protein